METLQRHASDASRIQGFDGKNVVLPVLLRKVQDAAQIGDLVHHQRRAVQSAVVDPVAAVGLDVGAAAVIGIADDCHRDRSLAGLSGAEICTQIVRDGAGDHAVAFIGEDRKLRQFLNGTHLDGLLCLEGDLLIAVDLDVRLDLSQSLTVLPAPRIGEGDFGAAFLGGFEDDSLDAADTGHAFRMLCFFKVVGGDGDHLLVRGFRSPGVSGGRI